MKIPRCLFIASLLALVTAANGEGSADFYAGGSVNRFSLLRDTASAAGFQLGVRTWALSWLGVDVGYADLGRVGSSFPVNPVYPPGYALPQYVIATTGTNTLSVSASAIYVLPVVRIPLGDHVHGWLEVGPERFESRIGSNLYAAGFPATGAPVGLGASGLEGNFAQTRACLAAMAKAGLSISIDSRWAVEAELHATGAPAITNPQIYSVPDIGNRRLSIWGAGLSADYRY